MSDEETERWADVGKVLMRFRLEDTAGDVRSGALLWRRVRLRLDARAERGVPRIGHVGGTDTRCGVLASLLREMASEEEARIAWVRWHLGRGDREGARQMGWNGGGTSAAEAAEGDGAAGASVAVEEVVLPPPR